MAKEIHESLSLVRIWKNICWVFIQFIGKIMFCLKISKIKRQTFYDSMTGNIISISVNPLFLIISVNGRDYYYYTVTGKFGGTGSRICQN
jgi:hypothetical protein